MRPGYRNLDTLAPAGYDVCEPKIDGRWATVEIADGVARLYGRQGQSYGAVVVPAGIAATLCAEQAVGTERAAASANHGAVVVFDCLDRDGVDLAARPLAERRQHAAAVVAALGAPFALGEQYPASEAPRLWARVEAGELEGLVFKSSAAAYGADWGRLKPLVDVDLVLMSLNRHADGRVRSVVGGAYQGGRLVRVCAVWSGLTVEDRAVLGEHEALFVGRVFTVYGGERTRAGSVRHPRWGGFHADKPAESCKLAA